MFALWILYSLKLLEKCCLRANHLHKQLRMKSISLRLKKKKKSIQKKHKDDRLFLQPMMRLLHVWLGMYRRGEPMRGKGYHHYIYQATAI